MKLRRRFITFAVVIHLLLVALSLLLFWHNRYFFIAAEALIIASLVVTARLYRSFLRPLDILAAGVDSIKDQDFSTTFIKTGQEELDKLIDVYNRMIEQLRTERVKQREQHYFMQRLIEATPIGVIILDLDNKITMLNPTARNILGVESEEAIGCPLDRLSNKRDIDLTGMADGETRVIKVGGVQTYRCRKSHFLDRGFHRHFVLIEELTHEILDAQKRAYEKVIRMMSHEVNNSVGAISSLMQTSLGYKEHLPAEDSRDFEHALQVAIDRSNGLNVFMANFADVVRIPPPRRESYDLHELLKSVQILMSSRCADRNITWQWDLGPSPMLIDMDVQQMEQVLVNIVKNAIEAIGSDGTITVNTEMHGSKRLRIIDTGKGLSAKERARLFTPFYSTKKDGQGIGLTLIREILVNHGFDFNLETSDNDLTVFWIDFDQQRPNY